MPSRTSSVLSGFRTAITGISTPNSLMLAKEDPRRRRGRSVCSRTSSMLSSGRMTGCCALTPLRSIGAPLMMLVNCRPQLL